MSKMKSIARASLEKLRVMSRVTARWSAGFLLVGGVAVAAAQPAAPAAAAPSAADAKKKTVEVVLTQAKVVSGTIAFADGKVVADRSSFQFAYKPDGLSEQTVTLDFGTDVSSFASGNLSTLAMKTQDGVAPGALTGTSFDASGHLVMTYANGQTREGPLLALARSDSPDAVGTDSDNRFTVLDPSAWRTGTAGVNGFGSLRTGTIEVSNVDLSREFSDLVVMQRGYQASSQIISTANEMLQELFQMKSK